MRILICMRKGTAYLHMQSMRLHLKILHSTDIRTTTLATSGCHEGTNLCLKKIIRDHYHLWIVKADLSDFHWRSLLQIKPGRVNNIHIIHLISWGETKVKSICYLTSTHYRADGINSWTFPLIKCYLFQHRKLSRANLLYPKGPIKIFFKGNTKKNTSKGLHKLIFDTFTVHHSPK